MIKKVVTKEFQTGAMWAREQTPINLYDGGAESQAFDRAVEDMKEEIKSRFIENFTAQSGNVNPNGFRCDQCIYWRHKFNKLSENEPGGKSFEMVGGEKVYTDACKRHSPKAGVGFPFTRGDDYCHDFKRLYLVA